MPTNLPAWPGTISIAANGTAITGTDAALTTGAQGALVIVNGLVGQLAADPADDNTATLLEPISASAITDAPYVLVPISGSVAQALRVRQTLETLAAQPTTASQIAAATETALDDDDEIGALQAASGNLIKRTWANIKAQLASFFLPLTGGVLTGALGVGGGVVIGATSLTSGFVLDVNGALNLRGGQIQFPATQNPSSGANVLDDYEEGSSTPGFSINGSTAGITYSFQTGNYTKVGNSISMRGFIGLTSKGTNTGVVRVVGAPFAVGSIDTMTSGYWSGFAGVVGNICGYVKATDSTTDLYMSGAVNTSGVNDGNLTNTSALLFRSSYFTA